MAKLKNPRSVVSAGAALGKAFSPRELHVLMSALNAYAPDAPADLKSAVRTTSAKLKTANRTKAKTTSG
jgi:hypothetical protein